MLKVKVYSKEGCGICDAAKAKLKRMGLPYEEHSLAYHINVHDGWRTDGTIDLMAHCAGMGDPSTQLPTIEIMYENEVLYFDYAGAMRFIRKCVAQKGGH